MRARANIHRHRYTPLPKHLHTQARTHAPLPKHLHTYTRTHACARTHVCTLTHACTHAHTHTHINVGCRVPKTCILISSNTPNPWWSLLTCLHGNLSEARLPENSFLPFLKERWVIRFMSLAQTNTKSWTCCRYASERWRSNKNE